MDALRAIEEGYTVRSLSPFYLKGFVKMYAEYLGMHVDEIIRNDPGQTAPPREQPAQGFDWEEWISRTFTVQHKRQIVAVLGILVGLFLLFKIITFFMHKKPEPRTQSTVKVKVTKKEAEKQREDVVALADIRIGEIESTATAGIAKSTAGSAKSIGGEKKSLQGISVKPPVISDVPAQTVYTAAQPYASPPPPVQKEITLTVRAQKDSWLHVKADGLVVFQSTLPRGGVETWIAHDRIEISGKNINQLEFELNGKILSALGGRGHRASKVVITKDGLSVIR